MSVPKQSLALPISSAQKRNTQSLSSARNRTSSSSIKKIAGPSLEDCIFCSKKNQPAKKNHFPIMINKALYSKYSSSQNYYFTKDINEILTNSRTSVVIKYKDSLIIDEEEDYLKRFYKNSEYDYKIRMLTEYYKFHKDISRLFMMPTTNVLNKYHDKKRRLEYVRVTKMLRDENELKNPSPRPKEKAGAEDKSPIMMDRILDNLEFSNMYIEQAEPSNNRKSGELIKGAGNSKSSAASKNSQQKPIVSGLNLQKAYGSNNQGT